MSIASPGQSHFDGGEISPLLQGRIDSDRYRSSLALCKNWYPTIQGALTRRPGTVYVGATRGIGKVRLIPFEYSTTQSYILEFGINYIYFWSQYGQVLSSGSPLIVNSPYAEADLPYIKYAQSADVLYLVHPNYAPRKLQRYGATNWRLDTITVLDGPYLPFTAEQLLYTGSVTGTTGAQSISFGTLHNVTGTANNGAGSIRVTLDSTTGLKSGQKTTLYAVGGTTEAVGDWVITVIDNTHIDLQGSSYTHAWTSGGVVYPYIFAATDVGRSIRIQAASTWGWGVITAVADGHNASIYLKTTLAGTTVSSFLLGAWSETTGYPACISFHQDRLVFGGPRSFPQRIDASVSSDYENFAPTATDGTVKDSSAFSFNLTANDVNTLEWLNSAEKGLMSGSVSAEWVIRPSSIGNALTPTNFNSDRSTRWGSNFIQAIQVGKATMFVQRGSRKVREMHYYYDVDGYRATDLTELAEHITAPGIIDMAYQSIPMSTLWLARSDGALTGMTYDRDITQLRTGWHWHVLGGNTSLGVPPIIESIAVIPSPDGTRDDLWMVVKRFLGTDYVRTVEYLSKQFEAIDDASHAKFLDCSSTYDNPIAILAATNGNPVDVATSTAHGFVTGDLIRIDGVLGLDTTLNGVTSNLVNGNWFKVIVSSGFEFQLQTVDGVNVSGAGYTQAAGGFARKLITHISGLTYLEGETVSIFADGAVTPDQVVTGGAITLPIKTAVATIGYSYNSDGQLLRTEVGAGARNGTALGKTRRIHRMGVLTYRSQGLNLGRNFENLDPVEFRTEGVDHNTKAVALHSGVFSHTIDFHYDFNNQLCFRVSQPVPCTILGFMPQMETQDRA